MRRLELLPVSGAADRVFSGFCKAEKRVMERQTRTINYFGGEDR